MAAAGEERAQIESQLDAVDVRLDTGRDTLTALLAWIVGGGHHHPGCPACSAGGHLAVDLIAVDEPIRHHARHGRRASVVFHCPPPRWGGDLWRAYRLVIDGAEVAEISVGHDQVATADTAALTMPLPGAVGRQGGRAGGPQRGA